MGYAEQYSSTLDAAFIGRVRQCLLDIAVEVIVANSNPTNVAIANQIVLNPRAWAERFSAVLVVDDLVTTVTTDADMKTRATALLPHYAAVVGV